VKTPFLRLIKCTEQLALYREKTNNKPEGREREIKVIKGQQRCQSMKLKRISLQGGMFHTAGWRLEIQVRPDDVMMLSS
jgi:hypothetical protein